MSTSTPIPPGVERHSSNPAQPSSRRFHPLGRVARHLWRSLPTLLILAVLTGIAYVGHQSHWDLLGLSAASETLSAGPVWCETHNVPEQYCIECRKDLVPIEDYGWCSGHGIQNCPLHHPELAQVKIPPAIDEAQLERVERALAMTKRAENNSRCTLYLRRVQFASAEAMRKAGVDVTLVEQHPVVETIEASGELHYNETQVATLASRAPGTVWKVLKQVGDRVEQGELLALVDAAEVGKAKAHFLQALVRWRLAEATQQRLGRIAGAVAGRTRLEAESEARAAQVGLLSAQQALVNLGLPVQAEEFDGAPESDVAKRIQFLGLPRELVRTLDAATTTANLLPVVAPFPGIVTERDVVAGEVVDAQKPLFVIADPTQMWLILHVPQEQVHSLELGQEVRFQPDQHGPEARGKIAWISTEVDPQTRTVQIRAEVVNSDGRLRAHLFGQGRIVLREEPQAVTVPNEAIHWDGSCHVVFVRNKDFFAEGAPKYFHLRTVRPGVKTENSTEVIAGLLPGEVIATEGSGVLLAQLLKSNLGAGCCGNE